MSRLLLSFLHEPVLETVALKVLPFADQECFAVPLTMRGNYSKVFSLEKQCFAMPLLQVWKALLN